MMLIYGAGQGLLFYVTWLLLSIVGPGKVPDASLIVSVLLSYLSVGVFAGLMGTYNYSIYEEEEEENANL